MVWTDRIELVTHAELFNVEDHGFYAVVEYVPSLIEALQQRAELPDVVVGDYLGYESLMDSLLVLDRSVRPFDFDGSDVYPGLLEYGRERGRLRLVPISFDLPGMLTLAHTAERLPDFMIDLDEVRSIGGEFNSMESERLTRLGYSPRWSSEFLYTMVRMLGVQFLEGAEGHPEWDAVALERALDRAGSWIEDTNGGLSAELPFEEQYLYDPMPQLVLRQRVLFAYQPASSFFSIAETRRRSFDIRWLSYQGRIPVLESVVYAGVLRESRNKRDAVTFVSWLAKAETHRRILQNTVARRLDSFGVLGGFSAHRSVNESDAPELYPSLLGKVPPAETLAFPTGVPQNWGTIKRKVVMPWLTRAVDQEPGLRSLSELVDAWMLHQGE